jgi:hypothetical protein
MEYSLGVMEDTTKESGKIILCMEKVCLYGKMDRNLREATKTTKRKARVDCSLLMELWWRVLG